MGVHISLTQLLPKLGNSYFGFEIREMYSFTSNSSFYVKNIQLLFFYYFSSSFIISKSEMQQSALVAFRDFLDWCIAIHFMPPGFLWSAQLYHYQVGIIGVISSLCRVHTYVINRQV